MIIDIRQHYKTISKISSLSAMNDSVIVVEKQINSALSFLRVMGQISGFNLPKLEFDQNLRS